MQVAVPLHQEVVLVHTKTTGQYPAIVLAYSRSSGSSMADTGRPGTFSGASRGGGGFSGGGAGAAVLVAGVEGEDNTHYLL